MDKEEYIPSGKEMEIIDITRKHIQNSIRPFKMEILDIVRNSNLQEKEKEEIIRNIRHLWSASHIPTQMEINYKIVKKVERLNELTKEG